MTQDGSLSYLPVSNLCVRAGHNPRRYFDPDEQSQLEDSVRAQGVLQPLVVRPLDDGRFEVVAGERRLRAAQAVGLDEVPTVIRVVDEDTAHDLATIENTARSNMSEAEEAQGARRVVDRCGGDRDAAAKSLGWSRRKLDTRLLLLHADESVLDALTERRIKIGAAELLSSLPQGIQKDVLEKYVSSGATVEALREKLDAFSFRLEKAVFDTAGCKGCPHNTSEQADLFNHHIGKARCTNPSCWKDKEAAYVLALKAEKTAEIGLVKLDTEADPATHTLLLKKDVGGEQLQACKSCAHYGALMATDAGRIGQLTHDVCFHLPCHREKVVAHRDALAEASPKQEDAPAATAKSGTSTAAGKSKAKKGKAAAATPRRVIEYAEHLHARAAGAEVFKQARLAKVFAVAAMLGEYLHENGGFSKDEPTSEPVKKVLDKHYPGGRKLSVALGREQMIASLAGCDDEALDGLFVGLAAGIAGLNRSVSTFSRVSYKKVHRALHQHNQTKLEGYFQMDKPFLETLTKGGIEAALREAGYDTWLNAAKGPVAFAKLMGKKRDEIIAAVLSSGFDFKGFVPSVVRLDSKAA